MTRWADGVTQPRDALAKNKVGSHDNTDCCKKNPKTYSVCMGLAVMWRNTRPYAHPRTDELSRTSAFKKYWTSWCSFQDTRSDHHPSSFSWRANCGTNHRDSGILSSFGEIWKNSPHQRSPTAALYVCFLLSKTRGPGNQPSVTSPRAVMPPSSWCWIRSVGPTSKQRWQCSL